MTHDLKQLRYAQDLETAAAEIAARGGRIRHILGPGAFVADLPAVETLTRSSLQSATALDPPTQLAVDAWMRPIERASALHRSWRGAPPKPPHDLNRSRARRSADGTKRASRVAGTRTSLHLNGSVAVGVLLVSGPETQALALGRDEQVAILHEVQRGLDWLIDAEPRARLSFVHDVKTAVVNTAPGPVSGVADAHERLERRWRDDALRALGHAPGTAGVARYIADLRARHRTDWAYLALFARYPVAHFAYARSGKIVMHADNGGWGRAEIDRVFAHETCHIFGAPDEYGRCACSEQSGVLAESNGNCINCFSGGSGQEACLMAGGLDFTFCAHTRRHLGWDPRFFPSP